MKFLVAAFFCCLPGVIHAASGMAPFEPGTSYYFDHFDPRQNPWQPGQDFNLEEVFKNYRFYEIRFYKDGHEIQVNRYIQNRKEGSEHYRIRPDGVLELLSSGIK